MAHSEHHILFILDRSGSMEPRRADVIGGFKQFIQQLRDDEHPGMRTFVSLVQFDDTAETVFSRIPIAEVRNLSARSYRPRGSTALLDAVHENVSAYRASIGQGAFGAAKSSEAPAVQVVVFTDGAENSSRRYRADQVAQVLAECEALGNWTFVYVGAHAEAWTEAQMTGHKRGNTRQFRVEEVGDAMQEVSDRTKAFRKAYAEDATFKQTEEFFNGEAEPTKR